MKVEYFTGTAYYELFDSVKTNHRHYQETENKWLLKFFKNKNYKKESCINVNLPELDSSLGDYANAVTIHRAFKDALTPKQASSPQLWTYLTHFVYWDYTQKRWASKDISPETVKDRFFCGTSEGSRIGFVRNAISRLWQIANLSYLEDHPARPYVLTELLTSNSDLCMNIIERNFSMNKDICIGILSAIKEINDDYSLDNVGVYKSTDYEWADLCKYLNRYGAVTVLDSLSRDEIKKISYDYILSRRREKDAG